MDDNGGLAALAVLFQDVTALRRAEADRERLPGRLIRMQEDDRRELATRLHRDVVRGLGATLRQLDGLEQQVPAADGRLRRSVRQVAGTLDQSLRVTRSLLSDLRPPLLDAQGLVAAISHQLGRIAVETTISISVPIRSGRDDRPGSPGGPATLARMLLKDPRHSI